MAELGDFVGFVADRRDCDLDCQEKSCSCEMKGC